MLNVKSELTWTDAARSFLENGHPINKPEILFTKIEDETIEQEINCLQGAANPTSNNEQPIENKEEQMERINFDTFKKIDLRVVKVLEAENVEKTDKLLKLQIDLGTEKRQIIAGIAEHYSPQELVGKQIVVVANLEPATIRGVESNGMLLAVSDETGKLALIIPEKEMAEGAKIS